jgi:outer membrane lipoprotein SlyB
VLKSRFARLKGKTPEKMLDEPLFDEKTSKKASRFGWDSSDTAVAGMTVGDLVYDIVHLDPMVLEAADFVRTEDLADIFRFSIFADGLAGLPPESFEGHLNQLQGYVAERFVGQHLQGIGAEVEFPESAAEPGYDLIVNGDPFQVKCLSGPDGVLEHFDKYPDIPVFVNEEVLSSLEGYEQLTVGENVFSIPGFTHEEILGMTESSFEAGHEVLDFEIPFISLAVATTRNLLEYYRYGPIAKKDLAINMATDFTSMTAGGFVGSKALGLSMMILFGPAGAVVGGAAGAIAGSVFGRKVVSQEYRNRRRAKKERRCLEICLEDLSSSAVKKSRSILTVQDSKLERLRVVAKNENPIVSEIREYVTWRLEQERSYKGKMCEELKAGRWKTSGFSSQKTALESASGLMEIIGAIGLHYHSIGDEWRKTIKALQKYVEKLQRKGRTKEKKTAGRN